MVAKLRYVGAAALITAQLAGCASVPPPNPDGLRDDQVARVENGHDWSIGRARQIGDLFVDDKPLDHRSKPVRPGRRIFHVNAVWSNGWREYVELAAELRLGRTYRALIYELAPGEDPSAAKLRRKGIFEYESRSSIGGYGPGVGLVLLLGLVYVVATQLRVPEALPRVIGRPSENCCFAWIQDAESGEVVAGLRPGPASR